MATTSRIYALHNTGVPTQRLSNSFNRSMHPALTTFTQIWSQIWGQCYVELWRFKERSKAL